MKNFDLLSSLYMLPVYFLALAISPNFTEATIGQVLGGFYVLLLPAVNYIAAGGRESNCQPEHYQFTAAGILALFMYFTALYLAWDPGWAVVLAGFLYLVLTMAFYRQCSLSYSWYGLAFLTGLSLFYGQYLALNRYGPGHLLNWHTQLAAVVSAYWVVVVRFGSYLKRQGTSTDRRLLAWHHLLMAAGLGVWLAASGQLPYLPLMLLAWLPALIYGFGRMAPRQMPAALRLSQGLAATGLVVFLVYYFLDTTQVLQAIRGGF